MSSKYQTLTDYLLAYEGSEVRLSFSRIEQILGFDLPGSARQYQAWWSNNPRSQSFGWLRAGWRSMNLDLEGEHVTFFRVEDAFTDALDDAEESPAATVPLTIAAAKLGLAVTYGVEPAQVDITIRG